MRLDSDVINTIRERVDADLDACERQQGNDAACHRVLHSVASRKLQSSETEILESFFQIVWLFNRCRQPALLAKKTADDLTKMAEYSLRLLGIKPYVSHLSYLYRIFYQARGKQLGNHEDAWLAAWNFNLGDAMTGNDDSAAIATDEFTTQHNLAQYHFQLGFLGESLEAFRKAEELASSDDGIIRSRFGMIRCLRILSETETALHLAFGLEHFDVSPELRGAIAWERALLMAQRDDDVQILVGAIKAGRKRLSETHLSYLILAILWCYASQKRGAIADMPRSAWLKRNTDASVIDQRSAEMLKLLQVLEECYSTKSTIFEKLKSLGDVLSDLHKADPSEEIVVFLAAVTRWLVRVKQKNSAVMVMNDYQRCSHQLSQGRSSALFGLLADLGDNLNASGETTRTASDTRSLKAGLERTFLFLEMFAKLFLTAVAGKTGTLIGAKSPEALQKELIVKLSQYFMQYAAGAMKGPIHKFAQIVLNIFSLPAEAEANFKSVLWSKQVLPEKTMRKVLEEDLGKKVEDVFAEFDFSPIGVGSVSQVYRARLHTGEAVAVKVQYPDLEKITRQDMAMFSRIFTGARWLFPKLDVAAIKTLVHDLVDREIDFRDEARVCLELGKIAARGARWSIPKLYPELSTRKVLTTEYISGLNLYQFSETASVEERMSAAMAVAEFGLRSVTDAGVMCVDPHPANLIFSEGKVYLIDFGFFMKVPASFVDLHRALTVIHGVGGEELVDRYHQTLRDVGLLNPSPQVPDADVREFMHVMVRQFNWESCGDPTLQEQFNELFFRKGVNRVVGSPTPEFFLSYLGKCQVFKTINRLGVPQPQEWSKTLAEEMSQREGPQAETAAAAAAPAAPSASNPTPIRNFALKTAPLGAA